MQVAAIYDIHANLPALEAVLDEIRRLHVDQVIVGGDVVPGPMPRETLELLLNVGLPLKFIYGNGEVAVLAPEAAPEPYRPLIRWTAEQLDVEDKRVLESWPKTLRMPIAGLGEVLFCHATPRDENELFTRLTPESRLASLFAGVDADIVVCGHTHMQFDLMVGRVRVVNAGSVGMPFGKAGADWLLLGPGVELRHTNYDLARAAERIRRSAYPQAEEFASGNVLEPPTQEKMLKVFSKRDSITC